MSNMTISALAHVHPGVVFGPGAVVEPFALIGVSPQGAAGEVKTVIGANCWFRSHAVVYAGNTIGDNLRTGHGTMLREHNEIGNDVSIGTQTVIEHHVVLRNGVRIHSQAFIPEFTVVEEGAWIGPRVCVTNAKLPAARRAKEFLRGVHVEPYARIGANCTLLPGIRIGRGAIIGAGSVVTRDVPPGRVWVGNPAQDLKAVADLRYPDGAEGLPYSEE